MIGLPGSGKSTLSQRLSVDLGGMHIASNDVIRRYLNSKGYKGILPKQSLLEDIAESSSELLFDRGVSHIIDADLLMFLDSAVDRARAASFSPFIIHVTAPEDTILRRLTERVKEVDNPSLVGTDDYFKRKKVHSENRMSQPVDFTINTASDDFEDRYAELLQRIKSAV